MPWDEFSDLLSGIGPDTALGRIVAIRAEEDEEILKHFTPDAKCRGVFIRCQGRHCKKEFEIKINQDK